MNVSKSTGMNGSAGLQGICCGRIWFLRMLCLLLLAGNGLIFCGSSTVWGQEQTPAGAAANVEAAAPEASPSAAETTASPAESQDRFIYIPYEKLNDVLDRLKSKVVISYEEYLELVKRAGAAAGPVKPGADVVITASDYSATVKGDVVEITAVFDCLALQNEWAELPVQFGNAAVGEFTTTGDTQVLLRGRGEGKYAFLFEKSGKAQLTIKLLTRVLQSPAGPSLELTVPSVGITTFSLTIPKPDHEITVSPRNIPAPKSEAAAGTSQVRVSLGATEKIAAAWVPRLGERPQMDLLTTVNNTMQISLRDGLIHTESQLEYRILRGELNQLRVVVPSGQRVLDVTSSSKIQGWTVTPEEQRQVVQVDLLGSVQDLVKLQIHTEQPLAEEKESILTLAGISESGKVHGIHALDVTREQGTLQVTHGEELSLLIREQSGLIRTETSANQPNVLSFRYFSPGFRFDVQADPVQPVVDVTSNTRLVFRDQRLESETQLNYTIRRAGLFQLELELPEQFVLQGVVSPQMTEYQYHQATRKLTIQLRERTQGNVTVEIRGHKALPASAASQAMELENVPLAVPTGVRQEEGLITFYAIDALELITPEDRVISAQPAPPQPERPMAASDISRRAIWKFQNRPVTIPVRMLRRPTRMTADVGTLLKVDPAGILVETTIRYQIQHAGIDQFRIAVPASVSDRVQIETVGPNDVPILQKTPEAPPTQQPETDDSAADPASQFVIWQIQTQRPVTGEQRFKITYDLPVEEKSGSNVASQPDLQPAASRKQVLLIQPRGLEQRTPAGPELSRSSGETLVQVNPALAVAVAVQGRGAESIDLRELQLLSRQGQQAYRYAFNSDADPIQLQLNLSRYEVESVVSTVVTRMLTEYVLGVSNELAVKVRMSVKSSQRQRLLLQLPADVRPMQVLVNQDVRQLQKGEPSSGSDWTNYYLNVSREGDSDQEFLLTLQYLQTIPPLVNSTPRGQLKLALPKLLTAEGGASVVQQSRALVWLPEGYVPVTVKKPFERSLALRFSLLGKNIPTSAETLHDQSLWVSSAAKSSIDFPTGGQAYLYESLGSADLLQLTYWNRPFVMAAFTLALLLISLILMRTTWENKILVVLITVTLLAVVLQFEPEVVKQGIYEARYGLFMLLAIWLIHGVFQCKDAAFPSRKHGLSLGNQPESSAMTDAPAPVTVATSTTSENVSLDSEDPQADPQEKS